MPSEDGRDMVARGWAGLKRPGDEIGVLFAVLEGGCKVLEAVEACGASVGAWFTDASKADGRDGSIVCEIIVGIVGSKRGSEVVVNRDRGGLRKST